MNTKGGNKKTKILALYRWKLNTCFDDQASTNLKMNLTEMDRNW